MRRLIRGEGRKREGNICLSLKLKMDSKFEDETHSPSLGLRPINSVSSFPEPAKRYPVDYNWSMAVLARNTPSVLLVEDNDESLFMLKTVLTRKGYRVVEAWDGKQAIEIAEAEELDLILLDLQLPRLNGLGVIHRLRQNAKLVNVPIVIITGQDPEKYRSNAIAEGCDDFLMKPIDFDRLDAVLDYYAPIEKVAA
jgi:CheY-like chemotaxis protein